MNTTLDRNSTVQAVHVHYRQDCVCKNALPAELGVSSGSAACFHARIGATPPPFLMADVRPCTARSGHFGQLHCSKRAVRKLQAKYQDGKCGCFAFHRIQRLQSTRSRRCTSRSSSSRASAAPYTEVEHSSGERHLTAVSSSRRPHHLLKCR